MLTKNIFLIGMKSCGKTTLGRNLAQRSKRPFFDLDELIEKEFEKRNESNKKRRLTFREIYKLIGEKSFRILEADTASILSRKISEGGYIISLGGGTAANKQAINHLIPIGFFIYLNTDVSVLFSRIKRNGIPSFLKNGDPYENLLLLYEKRRLEFNILADLSINLKKGTIDEHSSILEAEIRRAGYGW